MDDEGVIAKAFAENWILITNDKDLVRKCIESNAHTRALCCYGLKMNGWKVKLVLFDDCLKGMQNNCQISS